MKDFDGFLLPKAQDRLNGLEVCDGLFDDLGLSRGQKLSDELAVLEMTPIVVRAVPLVFTVFAATVMPTAGHPPPV